MLGVQEVELKTPASVKSIKKEVAALANDVASPVVEAVVKRVRTKLKGPRNIRVQLKGAVCV